MYIHIYTYVYVEDAIDLPACLLAHAACLVFSWPHLVSGDSRWGSTYLQRAWAALLSCGEHCCLVEGATPVCVVQGLVNFEGYYLDGEDVYAPREAVYQGLKLEDLEAEAKHTQNRTMVRLTSRYQIK